jgi:hypothetical protein
MALGQSSRRLLLDVPALLALGLGLAVNNTYAVLSGLVHRGGTFHRTPKYAIAQPGDTWRHKRYRLRASASLPAEILLAAYFTAATLYVFLAGMWMSLPFLALYLQGYGTMAFLSLPPLVAGLRLLNPRIPPLPLK